jgi:hypothetical protein
MNFKKFMSLMNKIEDRSALHGSYLANKEWPLVRLILYQNKDYGNQYVSPLQGVSNKSLSTLRKIINFFSKSVSFFLKGAFSNFNSKKYIQSLDLDDALVFISRGVDYSNLPNGKYFNKNIDPYIDILSKKHKAVKIHLESSNMHVPLYNQAIAVDPIILDKIAFIKFKIFGVILKVRHIFFRNAGIKKHICGLLFDEFQYERYLNEARYFSLAFEKVFKYSQPKMIFMTCYYSPRNMGIITACKKNKILVVDIAHGKIGKNHPMYTGWQSAPDRSKKMLPDYVWVWGNEINDIMSLSNTSAKYGKMLKSFVGGNMWINHWRGMNYDDKYLLLNDEQILFLFSLKKYERVILFTSQSEELPKCVLLAIRNSPAEWFWLIRSHPVHQLNRSLKSFKDLNLQKSQNYDTIHSSNLNLYLLFENVTHHVTAYSSTCYEAIYFGIPTIIIDEIGLELYKKYINDRIFFYSVSEKGIIKVIKSNHIFSFETEPYIETNIKTAEFNFNNLA